MRDLAYRRAQTNRAKQKAAKVVNRWWGWLPVEIDHRDIGKMASVHCSPCSCYMCGNPRRHFDELTVQERRHA